MKTKLLLVALLTQLFPLTMSAYDAEIDGIYYNFSGDEATVTHEKEETSYEGSANYVGDISIPETVTYSGKTYSVTSIGIGAFFRCQQLTSITIPSSVVSIGSFAFYACSKLTSINIPSNVTSIASDAFNSCGLTSITVDTDNTAHRGIEHRLSVLERRGQAER